MFFLLLNLARICCNSKPEDWWTWVSAHTSVTINMLLSIARSNMACVFRCSLKMQMLCVQVREYWRDLICGVIGFPDSSTAKINALLIPKFNSTPYSAILWTHAITISRHLTFVRYNWNLIRRFSSVSEKWHDCFIFIPVVIVECERWVLNFTRTSQRRTMKQKGNNNRITWNLISRTLHNGNYIDVLWARIRFNGRQKKGFCL